MSGVVRVSRQLVIVHYWCYKYWYRFDTIDNASAYLTGESIKINNISYNPTSGLATVTSVDAHGLVNAKVRIHVGIATLTTFGDFVVNQNVDLTTLLL